MTAGKLGKAGKAYGKLHSRTRKVQSMRTKPVNKGVTKPAIR